MTTNTLTKKDRKAIYARDGYRCALCDSTKYIQIHHYLTRGAGGTNHPHNLIRRRPRNAPAGLAGRDRRNRRTGHCGIPLRPLRRTGGSVEPIPKSPRKTGPVMGPRGRIFHTWGKPCGERRSGTAPPPRTRAASPAWCPLRIAVPARLALGGRRRRVAWLPAACAAPALAGVGPGFAIARAPPPTAPLQDLIAP